MATPFWKNVLCYVQAEPLEPNPMSGFASDYDAVALLTLRDDTFGKEQTAEEIVSGEQLLGDEMQTFDGPLVPQHSMMVTEQYWKAGQLGGVTSFLFFADGVLARAVADDFLKVDDVTRITVSEKLSEFESGLPYSALVELSVPGESELAALAGRLGPAVQIADLAVVAQEAVLWQRMRHGYIDGRR